MRRLENVNIALLCKWLWLFYKEENKLWRRVISCKYGVEPSGWFAKKVTSSHGYSVWKGIMGCMKVFKENIKFKVEGSTKNRFWKDLWVGNRTLEEEYPSLYRLAQRKNRLIVDHVFSWQDHMSWRLCPNRILNSGEQQLANCLLDSLSGFQLNRDSDRIIWKEDREEYHQVNV